MSKRPRKPVGVLQTFARAAEQFASNAIKDASRAARDAEKWGTSLARQAGLFPLGGSSRRFGVLSSGETISERQGKKRIAEVSPRQRAKERKFKRTLKRTGSVEKARAESVLSKRGFERVRAKTAVKKKGRYSFLPERGAREERALGPRHRWTVIQPSGGYRTVWFDDAGLAAAKRHREAMGEAYHLRPRGLIQWLRNHPGGRVRDADGHWVHFLTDVDEHHEAMQRMNKRQRVAIDLRYREEQGELA
jgi:hypothetical protein